MKRLKITLAVLLVASLLMGGLAYAKDRKTTKKPYTPTLTESGEVLGDPRHQQEPHKVFRLVRYRGKQRWASPLSAGSLVLWHTGVTSGDGVTVTDYSTYSRDNRIAGVMVTGVKTAGTGQVSTVVHLYRNLNVTADVNQPVWGWMQTYGKCRVKTAASGYVSEGAALYNAPARGQATTVRNRWTHNHQATGSGSFPTADCRCIQPGGFWMYDPALGTLASADAFLRCE